MMAPQSRDRRIRWAVVACGLAASLPLTPAPTAAQATTPASTIYEREVFDYPSMGRRDPFRPLNAGDQIGPRFENLRVSGVLFNPEIGSVATLTDEQDGRRYRVREGDTLGEVRVIAIRLDEVDFLISSFGVSRQETLRVKQDKESAG